MNIGTAVTWREAITVKTKNGRCVKIGERDVTGTVIQHGHLRTGAKTVKIAVTAATGHGQDIVGQQVWRKRTKVSKGRSWLKAGAKPTKPTRR